MTQFKVDFNDFKRRDNTNLMEITLYNDSGEKITPNRDHQWSGKALKFGDGDKRLDQELAVTLDGDKIGVPSKQLENLPSGDYGLELWEVNNDSKTIYPSAGFIEFHIHRNADESLESVTPTTDINKVIDDLHQAGLNVVVDDIEMLAPDATPSVTSEVRDGKNHIKLHVPRGLKGDKGDQGPQGPQGDPGPQGAPGDTPDLSNYVTVTDLNNGLSTKVTDNKNGTISVNGTSITPANENIIERIDWSYKDMNDIPMGWMYLNGWADTSKLANWGLPQDFYLVHCFKSSAYITATIQIAYGSTNNVYMRTMSGSNWSTWKLLADDSKIVHNTGNETISGDKVLVGNTTLATTTILVGNYGLRVTSSGFEKTTDGITWVPANI